MSERNGVDVNRLVRPDGWKEGTFAECRKQCPHAKIVRRETEEGDEPHRWQDWDCTHSENNNGPCDPSLCPIFLDPEVDEEGNDHLERWYHHEFDGFYEPNDGGES